MLYAVVCAQGNGSYISLNSVEGLVDGKIPVSNNQDVTFHFNYHNSDTFNKVKGLTNGFELSATGAATWVGSYGNEFTFDPYANFDLIWTQNVYNWDGAGADTVGFGGSVITGPGLPPGYSGPGMKITVNFGNNPSYDGETFCVDSCFYPPSGKWMWAYGSSVGSFPPDWDGPHCYTLYNVLPHPPSWVNPPSSYNGDHCEPAVVDFEAMSPDGLPLTFSNEGAFGTVSRTGPTSCQFSYQPVLADVGASLVAVLGVTDGFTPVVTTELNLSFTNQPPVVSCGGNISVVMGNTARVELNGDAVDCDPFTLSIVSIDPPPVGQIYLDGNEVVFAPDDPGDADTSFNVIIKISDGLDETTCSFTFDVLCCGAYKVQIEKTHNSIQGLHEIVDVTLTEGTFDMGGYDFMIVYDASALTLQTALPGDFHTACGWEYFNYRFGTNGNCGNACPSGMLEVVAIAETNNGANHPTCLMPDLPAVLFSLDFLISDDRILECMHVPIRFYWTNCTDNSIAYHTPDNPLAAVQGVSRFVVDFDIIGNIEDPASGFPTYTGVQTECLQGGGEGKPFPIQIVDFYNGGIDIICADSIDARGDVNLNGTPNEIADAVLFSNYFVRGLAVFNVNIQGQIASTDINSDGLTLSVADLVYLIRIITGDADPYAKLSPVAASYTVDGGVLSVDSKMAAAFIILDGKATPTLLADGMEMQYAFDGRNTRVLISKIERDAAFEGEFLLVDGDIVSIDFATYDGAPVAKREVPGSYALRQNYPNPFNPKTTISFAMPFGGDYTLTIYNVSGQAVASFEGNVEPGTVSIDWEADNLASGVYFYRLDTDNFTDTKKMVLLK